MIGSEAGNSDGKYPTHFDGSNDPYRWPFDPLEGALYVLRVEPGSRQAVSHRYTAALG